jgi:hypothetical protein
VAWSYVVKNTGNVALAGVVVTDSRDVAFNCHGVTTLVVAASMQCDAASTATLGQYSNVGSVTAFSLAKFGELLFLTHSRPSLSTKSSQNLPT